MAIEQAYVATYYKDGKQQISSVAHRQARCGRLAAKSTPEVVVVAQLKMQGERIFASWRSFTRQVRWCESCPTVELEWSWQDDAKCRDTWPAVDMLAFAQGGHNQPGKLIAEYCDHCPVRRDCALFALADPPSIVGIWGGVFVPAGRGRPEALDALRAEAGILPSLDAA